MNHVLEVRRELAACLNQLLQYKRWCQADIALHLGTTQPRVSMLQRGQLESISTDKLIEWLATLDHTVGVKVTQSEESKGTDRRYELLELGRKALAADKLMEANLWAETLWWEFPRWGPAGALKYDVRMARGHTIDAQAYRHYKDELAGDSRSSDISATE